VCGEKYRVIAWNAPGYLMSNNLKPEAPTCEDYGEERRVSSPSPSPFL